MTFLAAFVAGEVVGCGAVKRVSAKNMSPRYGEIKRVYVDSGARGRGVGGALLDALESSLLAHRIDLARLEDGRPSIRGARALRASRVRAHSPRSATTRTIR